MARSTAPGDPLIWLGLAAAVVFFVATGAIAYLNFQTLKTDSSLLVHSEEALTALEDVLSTVKDAETGQRGYLLTGNESYLSPYNAAIEEIGPRLEALRRLTSDNPAQQDRLAILRQRADAKLAELKQTIDLRQNAGAAAALAVVQSNRGKDEMDAIRAEVSAMEGEEIGLRGKRLAEMADAYWRAIASGIVSSLLGLGLTGVIGLLIFRAEAARRREDWLQAGRVGLSKAILGDQPISQLGDNILSYLCRYLDAHAGAVFSRDRNGPYRRISTYGVPAESKIIGPFCERRRPARAGGVRGPLISGPRRARGLSRHRFRLREKASRGTWSSRPRTSMDRRTPCWSSASSIRSRRKRFRYWNRCRTQSASPSVPPTIAPSFKISSKRRSARRRSSKRRARSSGYRTKSSKSKVER